MQCTMFATTWSTQTKVIARNNDEGRSLQGGNRWSPGACRVHVRPRAHSSDRPREGGFRGHYSSLWPKFSARRTVTTTSDASWLIASSWPDAKCLHLVDYIERSFYGRGLNHVNITECEYNLPTFCHQRAKRRLGRPVKVPSKSFN